MRVHESETKDEWVQITVTECMHFQQLPNKLI